MRKEMGLEYTDRIRVSIVGSERVKRVVTHFREVLEAEVLATEVSPAEAVLGGYDRQLDVDGEPVRLGVLRAS